MSRSPGFPPFRSSRAEARSCPKDPQAEACFSAGGSARTEVPLSAGLVLNPKVRCPASRFLRPKPPVPKWVPPVPEGRSGARGRFTKPAAFASAKGQARSFRLAAASSAALPSASVPACHPKAKGPNFRLGCGWEGFPPFPEDRLGHIRKLSRKMSRSKHNPPVDKEDNVHNSAAPDSCGPDRLLLSLAPQAEPA
jgi:hypothetical protein